VVVDGEVDRHTADPANLFADDVKLLPDRFGELDQVLELIERKLATA
jgi:hypothetical protein